MNTVDVRTDAPNLPRLSPSRLEAWDRCPAAYRFEFVLRPPQQIGDQRPRLLGSVAHALLEGYLQETLRTGARPPLVRVAAIAAGLLEQGGVPDAGADLVREAVGLVSRWLAQWTVPVESIVAVERALAVDRSGTFTSRGTRRTPSCAAASTWSRSQGRTRPCSTGRAAG